MKRSGFLLSLVLLGVGLLLLAIGLFSKPVSIPDIAVEPANVSAPDMSVLSNVDRLQDESLPQQATPTVSDAIEEVVETPDEAAESVAVWQPNAEAVASMSQAREQGDGRTPPISSKKHEEPKPTAEEVADPDLYLQYETRQQQALYRGYVEASNAKIQQLQGAVERAKSEGLAPEEIAMAEEKIRRIKAMRAQLLEENPGLMDVDAP